LEFQSGDIGIRGLDSPFFFDGEIFRKISDRINLSPTSGKNSREKVFTSAFSSIRVTSFTMGRNHGFKQLLITPEEANFSIEINTIVPGVWAVKTEEHIILPQMLKIF
jgi:hypothetical protein